MQEQELDILKLIAPGTILREGLDNILKAKTGALIVVAEKEDVEEILDGGFCLNQDFTPAIIYELSKIENGKTSSKKPPFLESNTYKAGKFRSSFISCINSFLLLYKSSGCK